MRNIFLLVITLFSLMPFYSQASIADVNTTAITIANQYPNYPATPGDVYEINFMVANDKQEIKAFVDNSYNIDLSFIGKVNVKDLKYYEVQEKLKSKVIESYPGSIVNVLITIPGRFKVTLLGEVNQAYHIDIMSLTTLAQIIYGKTTKYASTRDIEIRSENDNIETYDLFQFYRYADLKNNPYLRPNDVITIRPYDRTITLAGEVKRPGTYQLLEGDSLADVINSYGDGFTKLADKERILIQKTLEDGIKFNNRNIIINSNEKDISLIEIEDFDIITVSPIIQQTSNITVEGEVLKPGTYELIAGSTLNDLIDIHSYGFTKFAELSKIEIKRFVNENDEFSHETLYIDGNNEELSSIVLNDRDVVTIHNKIKFMPKVYVQGAISNGSNDSGTEGTLGLNVSNKIPVTINSGSKVSTVVNNMGATFNLSSDLEKSYVLRGTEKIDINLKTVIEGKNIEDNIVMEENDVLVVPFRQLVVYVAGSVNESKAVPFIENRTAKYYIGLAGGTDREENLFGTYSVRNVYGEKVNKNAIISPEDVIWVNRDNPFSYLTEYKEYITTAIGFIGLYALMNSTLTQLDALLDKSTY